MARAVRGKRAKQKAFIAELKKGWSISRAATIAGVQRRETLYDWRKADFRFAAAWDEAYEIGSDYVEDLALKRADEGTERKIYDGEGNLIERRVEPSDRLLELLLKARKPRQYAKPETQINNTVNMTRPLTVEEIRQKYRDLGVDVDQLPLLLETDEDAIR